MADFISLDDLEGAQNPQAIPPSPDQAPSWGDYGGYLASGASNALADLASGVSYAAGKLGDPDAELALSKVSTATRTVGADQQADLSPAGQNALTSWDHPLSHIVAAGLQSAPSLAAPVVSGALLGPVAAAAAMAGQSASQYLGAIQDHLDQVPDDHLQAHSPMYAGLRSMMPEDQARDQFRDALADNNYGLLANAVVGAVAGVPLAGAVGVAGVAGKGLLGRVAAGVAERGAANAGLSGVSDLTTQNSLSKAGVQTNPDYLGNMAGSALIGAVVGLPGDLLHGRGVDVVASATGPDMAQNAALKSSLNTPEQPGIGVKGQAVLDRNPASVKQPLAPSPGSDVGQNVPEAPATLAAQQDELEQGKRPAVLYPKGTTAPDVPEGMKQARIKEGVVHFDPDQLKRADVFAASKNNTLNDLLGLGPVNKDQVAASAAQGNPLVAVTERQPDGTSTKEAVGTTGTAPEQVAALEANKQPGNTVGVETPQSVLAGRMFQDPLETQPRDVGTESQAPANPGERSSANAVTTEGNAAGAERRMYSPEPPAKSLGAGANLPRPKPLPATPEAGAKALITQMNGAYNHDDAHVRNTLRPIYEREHKMSPEEHATWIKYTETRDPELRENLSPGAAKDADTLRSIMKDAEYEIGRLDTKNEFEPVENYVPRIWEAPVDGKEYSAWQSIAEHRHIPSIEEGLAAGLKLKHDTRAEAAMEYIHSLNRYLKNKEIRQELYKQGVVSEAAKPEYSLVNSGSFTRHPVYMPDKIARDYTNWADQHFTGKLGAAIGVAKTATNVARGVSFALSPFHALTVSLHSLSDGFSDAVGQALRGNLKNAASNLARPISATAKGAHALNEWEGKYTPAEFADRRLTALDKQAFDLGVEANAFTRRGNTDLYRETGPFGSIKSLGKKALSEGNDAVEAAQKKAGYKAVSQPALNSARALGRAVSRGVGITSDWLFESYIPRLKSGMIVERTKEWLQANSSASHEEQVNAAIKIREHVDRLIGEAARENFFINKAAVAAMDIGFLAPSWVRGSMENMGHMAKGPVNLARGRNPYSMGSPHWEPASGAFFNVILTSLAIGGLSTWTATGKPPQSLLDYAAPLTGGKNKRGEPERALLPGEMRFVLDIMHAVGMPGAGAAGSYSAAWAPFEALGSKLNPLIHNFMEATINRDYRGKQVVTSNNPFGAAYQAVAHTFGVKPFWWRDEELPFQEVWKGPGYENTGIPLPLRIAGIAPASMAYSNPQGFRGMLENKAARSGAVSKGDRAKDRHRHGAQ